MRVKKWIKNRIKRPFLRYFFAVSLIFGGIFSLGIIPANNTADVYAVPDTTETTDETTETTDATDASPDERDNGGNEEEKTDINKTSSDNCLDSLDSIGWLVCPTTGKIAEAVDWIYGIIEKLLVVNPIESEDGSPIYEIWKYCRGLTNIVFIIFLLVVIYSQLTGFGISNYGLKKALPKLIVAAVLVNLSFLICQFGIDISNIIGNGLRGIFTAVQESALSSMTVSPEASESMHLAYSEVYGALAGGSLLAVGAGVVAFESGTIWMLIPVVLGAIVAVASGLITIALRQAVVVLLVMISPLAIVAYMLPNTENLFKKWRKLLIQMLVFYPMFSLLFGASSLAGFALIASAQDAFWLILGVAVQIFPLFFSWSLMKMSGTFLGSVNSVIRGLASRPIAATRSYAGSRRDMTKAKNLATGRTPSLALMQYMQNRKIARELQHGENVNTIKNRGAAYRASLNYKGDGSATKKGARAYQMQAENMQYSEIINRDKHNMDKGLGQLAAQPKSARLRARLAELDTLNVNSSDRLKAEMARGASIEYGNARDYLKRMNNAINAHMDDTYGYEVDKNGNKKPRSDYKFHFADNKAVAEARARYSAINKIMEGDVLDTQYVAATAAHAYDTQKKIRDTNFGKHFEYTPPTKDVVYRLSEFTQGGRANENIDSIISGLRVLNQRGDTDLVKDAMKDVLREGVDLGTHASQSLASFLMFEVKDNDPFLRRFGKYINLETARAYNKNERQEMKITYDEFFKGYHIEPDGSIMYAKRPGTVLMEGTSFDNMERTALNSFDEELVKMYSDKKGKLDVDKYIEKREEFQKAIGPAFISASLKYLSGSEQLKSAVSFLTGYSYAQVKDENDNVVLDGSGNPLYAWSARWEKGGDMTDNPEVARKYFEGKTETYFQDQTPGQILSLRSDYRDPVMEHLVNAFLGKEDVDEKTKAKQAEYSKEFADIQTRYRDLDPKEAKEKRDNDIKNLKMKIAGEEFRGLLDSKGKLEQIYRTRRSGAANNAKDWVRQWLNLDDDDEVMAFLNHRKAEHEKKRKEAMGRLAEEGGDVPELKNVIYDESFRNGFVGELERIIDDEPNSDDDEFYESSMEKLKKSFGDYHLICELYKQFHDTNSYADKYDMLEYLTAIISDENNYS